MSAVITKDGENLIARCQAEGRVLKIDKMIIGNVPGVDPLADIDRDSQKPTAEQIVDELVIPEEYKAYVNPNQVVYSIVMDANRGNYDFNWIGLYSSEDDVVVAITTLPTLAKYRTEGQRQGNHLTRNFMLEYFGAKESTGMSVAAETWQLDHSARLGGMDERIRLIGRDLFGDSVFWEDGWKLVKEGESYKLLPGVGYVAGIKIDLAEALPISGEYAPKYVWLDVSLQPKGSEVVAVPVPVYGLNFEDYRSDGIDHYFVKIAKIDVDGSCIDYRKVEAISRSFFDYFRDVQQQLENRLDIPQIEQPRNISPIEGAVDVQDPVTFTFSVPRSLFGKNIVAVEFELATDKDMQNVIHSKTVALDNPTGETAYTAPNDTVQEGKPFWWWFCYVDEDGDKSPYSVATGFSTALVFEYVVPPSIIFPADGSEDVKAPLTVRLSDFAVFNADDTLAATKVEASYDNFETVFYDSGEVAPGGKIEITEADGLVVSRDVYLQPYHKGTTLGWSAAGPVSHIKMADLFNAWPNRTDASLDGLAAPLSTGTAYYGGVKALNSDQQVTVYEDDPNNRLAIDVTSVSGSSVSKLGGVFIETGAFTALGFAVISELEIAVFYLRSSDSHNMLAFFSRESTASYTFAPSQTIDFGLTAAGNYVGTGATMTETELAFVHGREFYMVTKSGGNWAQGSALATLPSESFGYGAALAKLSDTAIACAFQKTIGSPRGTGMLVISRPEKASTAWVAGSEVEISPNSFSNFHNGITALSDTEFCIGTMNSTGQHRGIFASIPTTTSNVPTVDQDVLILGDGAGAYISPVLVMENTVLWFFVSSTAGHSTVVSKDETWEKGADVLINNSSSPYITGCRVDDNTVLSTYTNSGDGSRQTAKVVIGG